MVKENSKASDLLAEDDHIDEIIILDKEKDGLGGFFKLSNELKKKSLIKFLFLTALSDTI